MLSVHISARPPRFLAIYQADIHQIHQTTVSGGVEAQGVETHCLPCPAYLSLQTSGSYICTTAELPRSQHCNWDSTFVFPPLICTGILSFRSFSKGTVWTLHSNQICALHADALWHSLFNYSRMDTEQDINADCMERSGTCQLAAYAPGLLRRRFSLSVFQPLSYTRPWISWSWLLYCLLPCL